MIFCSNKTIENLEHSLKELCKKRDEISYKTIQEMYDKNLDSNAPSSEFYEICDKITKISLKLLNIYSQNEEIVYLQEKALFMEEYVLKTINDDIKTFKEMEKSSGNKVKIGSINDVVAFLCEKRSSLMKEIDKIEKRIKELS